MSHGMRGFVEGLPGRELADFEADVCAVLAAMHDAGGIVLERGVGFCRASVPTG